MTEFALQCVLFDLDGTLVDSAPDLIAALNFLLHEEGRTAADFDALRPMVSKGARAILRRGFADADEDRIEILLPRFLDIYATNIAVHSRLFAGMDDVLQRIENSKLRWGVVSNKVGWLAQGVLDGLKLSQRCAVLVAGDTLAVRKPDPAPILHACQLAGVDPHYSVYVGDDVRDIQAGRAAGLRTIAVSWGYLNGENPRDWGADIVVESAPELQRALGLAEPVFPASNLR